MRKVHLSLLMQWSAAAVVMRSCVRSGIAIALLSLTGWATSPTVRCRVEMLLAIRFVPPHALMRLSRSRSAWIIKVRP